MNVSELTLNGSVRGKRRSAPANGFGITTCGTPSTLAFSCVHTKVHGSRFGSRQLARSDAVVPELTVYGAGTDTVGASGGLTVTLTGAEVTAPAALRAVRVKVMTCAEATTGAVNVEFANPGVAIRPPGPAICTQFHAAIGVGDTAEPNSVITAPDATFAELTAAVTIGSVVPGLITSDGPSTHGIRPPATTLLTADE